MRNKLYKEGLQQLKQVCPKVDLCSLGLAAGLSSAYHIFSSIMDRRYAKKGISSQSADVLFMLYISRPHSCSLGEISYATLLRPSNVSGLIEGLVRKGFVNRQVNPTNRRKKLVQLTPQGIDLMDSVIPDAATFIDDLLSDIPPEDRNKLLEMLSQLSEILIPYWEKRPSTQ